jgi:hypothetical protein
VEVVELSACLLRKCCEQARGALSRPKRPSSIWCVQEDILVKYLADSLQAVHEGLASTSGRAGTALVSGNPACNALLAWQVLMLC